MTTSGYMSFADVVTWARSRARMRGCKQRVKVIGRGRWEVRDAWFDDAIRAELAEIKRYTTS